MRILHSGRINGTCEPPNVFPICPLSVHTLAHSFARTKNITHLFSSDSALFAKNTRGGAGAAVVFLTKNFKTVGIALDSGHLLNTQTIAGSPIITSSLLASSSLTSGNRKLRLDFVTSLPHYLVTSIERRNRVALLTPPMPVVHRNVQVTLAARRLDANHQRFGVRASGKPRVVHMNFRRKHFEVESLIVQQRYRISDDHVRQLANCFFHQLITVFNFHPCMLPRHLNRHFRPEMQHILHSILSVASDASRG